MAPYSILIPHLGDSLPPYLWDCIHQIRLWNSPHDVDIYCIVEPSTATYPEWLEKAKLYSVTIVPTTSLPRTPEHETFLKYSNDNTTFRNGYWKYTKERFFYMEECMVKYSLKNSIAIEYDILMYQSLSSLVPRILSYTSCLSFVMDNPTRGHPACIFIPTAETIRDMNEYIVEFLHSHYTDMQLMSMFAEEYPEKVTFLPLLTPTRNASIQNRSSLDTSCSVESPTFLSNGFNELGVLFDSLVVGQYLAGIDPRNTEKTWVQSYKNEGALYTIDEMQFEWRKAANGLWQPFLDTVPLVTIHMHSKDLKSFVSDIPTQPRVTRTVEELLTTLVPN